MRTWGRGRRRASGRVESIYVLPFWDWGRGEKRRRNLHSRNYKSICNKLRSEKKEEKKNDHLTPT
jgi:hypothetical protein